VSPGGTVSAAQRYRLQATKVRAMKTATAVVIRIAAKNFPHKLVNS